MRLGGQAAALRAGSDQDRWSGEGIMRIRPLGGRRELCAVRPEMSPDERAEILAEAAALKESAMAYMHPEVGVIAVDGACFGRNFFNRPSAPETEDAEEAKERAIILAEAASLKKSAVGFMHPEVGVAATDPTVFGRNYFNRPSAPETEEDEFTDERAEILAEASALKKLAAEYMHPEVGVTSADGACFGRNYFERPSAPETEDLDEAEEHARVLADALALKKSAADYMHPEVEVTSADGAGFGRNFFNRASAPETEDVEEAEALPPRYRTPAAQIRPDDQSRGRTGHAQLPRLDPRQDSLPPQGHQDVHTIRRGRAEQSDIQGFREAGGRPEGD